MTRSLQHALDEALGFIEQALEHIRAGEGSELELQNLRAYLLDILAAIERNPGVEAACDDLYASAKELALGRDKGARMARLMESSMLRLRERLATRCRGRLTWRNPVPRLSVERRSDRPASCSAGQRATLLFARRSQRRLSTGLKPVGRVR